MYIIINYHLLDWLIIVNDKLPVNYFRIFEYGRQKAGLSGIYLNFLTATEIK